jgi:toxin FitB
MGKKYLIDTNILLEYLANGLPTDGHDFINTIIDSDFNISVINKIEILGHDSSTQEIEDFLNLANTFQLNEAVVKKTIDIRKTKKIKLPDAIIAATAIVYDLELITRNTKDFISIVRCLDPFTHKPS